ncbi:MAG: hypothetical protein EZS28_016705 [Streblomastix strix]|uniref:Uncharacterized protein n=1 Tax=Streblomastix strix TaxID=222440 RepID=A0A5J4VYQ2_9EUKA|nr:MAG: hypothetical protein EZS28_016705 [Streblomastix strix]
MLAPGSSWQHPFFNILTNFPAPRRAQTTNVKEVNIQFQNKDSVVNFKCIQIMVGTGSGNRTGNQFLKIPGAGDTQRLGLTGKYRINLAKYFEQPNLQIHSSWKFVWMTILSTSLFSEANTTLQRPLEARFLFLYQFAEALRLKSVLI